MQTKKSQAGFSLAEMLVVLGVLMVGGAVTIMNVSGAVRGAHDAPREHRASLMWSTLTWSRT